MNKMVLALSVPITLGAMAAAAVSSDPPEAKADGCGGSASWYVGLDGIGGQVGGGCEWGPGPDYLVDRPGLPPGNCCGGPGPEVLPPALPPKPNGNWVWNGADWVPPGDPRWWPQEAWYDGFNWVSVQVNCGYVC